MIDWQPHINEAVRQALARMDAPPEEVQYARWYNARHPTRKVSAWRLNRPMRFEAWWRFNPWAQPLTRLVGVVEEDAILNGTGSGMPVGIIRT